MGCNLHDLIQPSFSFLVGVALPFSIASRTARGSSFGSMFGHTLWRALLLILLGVALRSTSANQTNWTFEDTLSQIGLGYPFLFLLAFCSFRKQGLFFGLIVLGYWLAFVLYPLPRPELDYSKVGASADWISKHAPIGFEAHWSKNTNPAWAFDTWFLNLFPREKPFVFNGGGYSTLSFIPTLATMILGLMAGGILKSEIDWRNKTKKLLILAAVCFAIALAIDWLGLCPNVKKIWTPTWVLFSGGWCFAFLAFFYAIMEGWNKKAWSYPLLVIGANSIAAYCIAHLFDGFFHKNLMAHLGKRFFQFAGPVYEPFLHGFAILVVFWLILWWMYRRKLFLKI
jgi:predicted acyltransferase